MSTWLGFFDTEGFMPHGYCLMWKPSVFWLSLISDAVIALAYYSIPFVLLYFASHRRDLVFRWVFYMFGIFIWAAARPTSWASGRCGIPTTVSTASSRRPLRPCRLPLR